MRAGNCTFVSSKAPKQTYTVTLHIFDFKQQLVAFRDCVTLYLAPRPPYIQMQTYRCKPILALVVMLIYS